MISILTVTNRPKFIDWVSWNVSKQTYSDIEWIIINSSGSHIVPKFNNVKIFNVEGKLSELRNVAMSKATSDYFVWMDDDDWQHPMKLETLMFHIGDKDVVGWGHGWFVDLATNKIRKYKYKSPIYINSLFKKNTASLTRFEINLPAADTYWMSHLLEMYESKFLNNEHLSVPSFWLRHGRNDSKDKLIRSSFDIKELRLLSGVHWQDTDERLRDLRLALDSCAA